MSRIAITSILFATSLAAYASLSHLPVGDFGKQGLNEWVEHSFKGNTTYVLTHLDGDRVVKAESRNAASGLFREITVDLEKTPYLSWRWRINNTLGDNNEQSKEGDDYPARIYVVKKGGLLPWRTKAVNYVWSSNQSVGSSWHNPYSNQARMIALRSGQPQSAQWETEKRNVRADFQKLFGEDVTNIDVIALMTDTDNTGGSATAYYSDIVFSAE